MAPIKAIPPELWEMSGVDPYSMQDNPALAGIDSSVREELRKRGIVSAPAVPAPGSDEVSIEEEYPATLVGLDRRPLKTRARIMEGTSEEGTPAEPRLEYKDWKDGKPVIAPGEEDLFFEGQPDVQPPEYILNRFYDIELMPGDESPDTSIGRAKIKARQLREKYGDSVPGVEIQSWHNKIDEEDLANKGRVSGAGMNPKDIEAGRTGAGIFFEKDDSYKPFQWWAGKHLRKKGAGTIRKSRHENRYMPSEEDIESRSYGYRLKVQKAPGGRVSRKFRDATQGAVEADRWAGSKGAVDPYALRVLTTKEMAEDPVLAKRQEAKKRREVDYSAGEMALHDFVREPSRLLGKATGFASGLLYGTAKGVGSAVGLGNENQREAYEKSLKQRNQQVTQLMGPSVLANFANDFDLIADVFTVFGKELLGLINSEDMNNAVTADEVLSTAWREGSAFGEELGVGSIADLVVFTERPLESIRANPAIALMQAVGLGKAMYHTLAPDNPLRKGVQYLSDKFQNLATAGVGRLRPGVRLALLKAFGDSTAAHNANTGAFLYDYQRAAREAPDDPIIRDPDRDFSVISEQEAAFLSEFQARRKASEQPDLSPAEMREVLVRYRQAVREGDVPQTPKEAPSQTDMFEEPTPIADQTKGYEMPFDEKWDVVERAEARLGRELSPDEITNLMEMHARKSLRDQEAALVDQKAAQAQAEREARKQRQRIEAAKKNKELAENPQLVHQKAMESALKGERVPDDIAAFLNEDQLAELQGLASKVSELFPKLPPGADVNRIVSELWYESQVRQPSVLRQDAARIVRVLEGMNLSDPISRHTTQATRSVTRMGEKARGTVYDAVSDISLLVAEVLESADSARIISAINKTVPVPKSAGNISAWDYLLSKRDEINKVAPEKLKEATKIYDDAAAKVTQVEVALAESSKKLKAFDKKKSPQGREKYGKALASMLPKVKDGEVILTPGLGKAINRGAANAKNKGKKIERAKAKAENGFKILNEKEWADLDDKGRNALIAQLKKQDDVVTDGGASSAAYDVDIALRSLYEQKRAAEKAVTRSGIKSAKEALSALKADASTLKAVMERWGYVVKDAPLTRRQALTGRVEGKGKGATGDRLARFQRKIDEQFGVSVRADDSKVEASERKKQSEKLEELAASGKEPWSATTLDDQGRPIVERSGFGPVRTDVGMAIQDVLVGKDAVTPAELYRLLKEKMGDDLPVYVQGWRPAADLSGLRTGTLDAGDVLAMVEGKVALYPEMGAKELAALHPGLIAYRNKVYMAGNYIDGLSAGEIYRKLGEKASKHKPDIVEAELLKDNNIDTLLENRIKQKPEEAKELAKFITSDIVDERGLFDNPFSDSSKTVSAERAANLSFKARTAVTKQQRKKLVDEQLGQDVRFFDGQFSLPVIVGSREELARRIDAVAEEAGVSGSRLHRRTRANAIGAEGSGKAKLTDWGRSKEGPLSYVEVAVDNELITSLGLSRKRVKTLSDVDGEVIGGGAGDLWRAGIGLGNDGIIIRTKKGDAVFAPVAQGDVPAVKVGQKVKKGQALTEGKQVIDLGDGKTLDSIFMPKEMKSRLDFYRKYDEAMNDPLRGMGRFFTFMKANMAPRSIASHTYNFTSNVLLTLVRTGDLLSPVKLYQKWSDLTRYNAGLPLRVESQFDKWRKGRDINDPKVLEGINKWQAKIKAEKRIWKAMADARIVKSNIIESEFKRAGEKGFHDAPEEKKKGWFAQYFATLEDAYGQADIPFKVNSAYSQIKKDFEYLDMLKEGEWFERRVSPTQKVRIVRGKGGKFSALRVSFGENTGWRAVGKAKPLNAKGPDKILGRFARFTSGMQFVNYEEVGMLNMLQRRYAGHGVFGLLNAPYTSYALASSYIPGVKRGVQGSLLSPNGRINTNSAAVNRSFAADEFKSWAQRQWVFSAAARNESSQPGPEMLSFMMSQYRLKDRKDMAVYMTNPAGPSALFMVPTSRVGVSGSTKSLFNVVDDLVGSALDPIWQRLGLAKSKTELGQLVSEMSTVLSKEQERSGKGSEEYKLLEKRAQATYAAFAKSILRSERGWKATVRDAADFAAMTGENFAIGIWEAFDELKDGDRNWVEVARKVLPMLVTPTVASLASPVARELQKSLAKRKAIEEGSVIKERLEKELGRKPSRAEFEDRRLELAKEMDSNWWHDATSVFVQKPKKGSVEQRVSIEEGSDYPVLRDVHEGLSLFANSMVRAYAGSVYYQLDLRTEGDRAKRLKDSVDRGIANGFNIKALEENIKRLEEDPSSSPESIDMAKEALRSASYLKNLLKAEADKVFGYTYKAARPEIQKLIYGEARGEGPRKDVTEDIRKAVNQ